MADDTFDWKIDGSGFGQSTATSCWYAAYAIIHKWKGRPQSAIREKIEAAGLNYADYYNNGLPIGDFPKTRAALGLVGWRGGFVSTIADDFKMLVTMLKGYGPMWCAFAKPSAHVVVVTGCDAGLNEIHILNPWNNSNGADADSQYLTPGTFRMRLNSQSDSVFQSFM